MSYKPLPEYLTVLDSNIDGLGLFAIRKVDKGLFMMQYPSHYILQDGSIIRTSIGGFVNHSTDPNCRLIERNPYDYDEKIYKSFFYIQPIRDISSGEELTLDYTKEFCGLEDYKNEKWLN